MLVSVKGQNRNTYTKLRKFQKNAALPKLQFIFMLHWLTAYTIPLGFLGRLCTFAIEKILLFMENSSKTRFGLLAGMILLAALSRLLPHPPNFTPVTAMALFGGAYLLNKKIAFIIPILAMWISDLILNNLVYAAYFEGFSWYGNLYVYGAMILIVALGIALLKKVTIGKLIGVSLGASLIFFLISNFGSWLQIPAYSKDFNGLLQAYAAGLPFLRNSILGTLFYSGVLFGTFEWLKSRYPALQFANG